MGATGKAMGATGNLMLKGLGALAVPLGLNSEVLLGKPSDELSPAERLALEPIFCLETGALV